MFCKQMLYVLIASIVFFCSNPAISTNFNEQEVSVTKPSVTKVNSQEVKEQQDQYIGNSQPAYLNDLGWIEAKIDVYPAAAGIDLIFHDQSIVSNGKALNIQTWYERVDGKVDGINGNLFFRVRTNNNAFDPSKKSLFPQQKQMRVEAVNRSYGHIDMHLGVENLTQNNYLTIRAVDQAEGMKFSLNLFLGNNLTLVFGNGVPLKNMPLTIESKTYQLKW